MLQHTLRELWERRIGQSLKLDAYRELGGLNGAIEHYASSVFQQFSESEKDACRKIFLRLVQPSGEADDWKRRVPINELGATDIDQQVIEKLARSRLIVVEKDISGVNAKSAEVAHEALVRQWKQLRDWVEADRDGLRIQHRLSQAANDWVELDRSDDVLYRGIRLKQAVEWSQRLESSLIRNEREFLEASIAHAQRKQSTEESNLNDVTRLLHDIKGPLVAFGAAVDRIEHESKDAGYRFKHDYIGDLKSYSDLLKRIVQGVDVVRSGDRAIRMVTREVELLQGVLAPVLLMARPLLRLCGMSNGQITTVGFDSVPPLHVDPQLLSQAFFNIIENAIKYCPKEMVNDFRLNIEATSRQEVFEIVFCDNGAGIEDETVEHIFQQGFRGRNAQRSSVEGTGIGLWVARKIIVQHGGDIQLRTTRMPTQFVVRLPKRIAREAPLVADFD